MIGIQRRPPLAVGHSRPVRARRAGLGWLIVVIVATLSLSGTALGELPHHDHSQTSRHQPLEHFDSSGVPSCPLCLTARHRESQARSSVLTEVARPTDSGQLASGPSTTFAPAPIRPAGGRDPPLI